MNDRTLDVWQKMAALKEGVVMYGTGNGADKLLTVFERYGIRCRGFFASDGFVRNRTFHDLPVLSYTQAVEQFGKDMVIAVGFASNRPEVVSNITALAEKHTLYMPPVPVAGDLIENSDGEGGIFDAAYYRRHKDEISACEKLFLDEKSRVCYNNLIDYRLSGDISYLLETVSEPDEIFRLLGADGFRTAMDIGAYRGDTLLELCRYAPRLGQVLCAEPDPRTFTKLEQTAAQVPVKTTLFPYAAWNEGVDLTFGAEGNRGSGQEQGRGKKTVCVRGETIDFMAQGEEIDYIKYDVEGAERRALLGSVKTIRRCRPSILLSLYHRTEDLFRLPLHLHEINPSYRLMLRRTFSLPDWEIHLLATEGDGTARV